MSEEVSLVKEGEGHEWMARARVQGRQKEVVLCLGSHHQTMFRTWHGGERLKEGHLRPRQPSQ